MAEDTTFQIDRNQLYPSEIQSVLVGTVSTAIVGSAPTRRAMVFTSDGTNTITLSNTSPVVIGQGLTIPNTFGTLELRREQYGSIITRPWFAIGNAAGARVNFIEVLDSYQPPVEVPSQFPDGQPGYFRPGYAAPRPYSSRDEPAAFATGPDINLRPETLQELPSTPDVRH